MIKNLAKSFVSLVIFLIILAPVLAGPESTSYELKEWTFGSGGTAGSDSTTYSLFGISGEIDSSSLDSTTYTANGGLVFAIQAGTPPAPTFSNPSTNYERLKLVIGIGGNPSDAKFAVAISTDDFVTTNYIQSDFTVGSSLGSEDWMTYSTWGSASGQFITGLTPGTTYKVKVKAKHGNFTETGFGPTASATTSTPSLTFSLDAHSITFDSLSSANSYTDSAKSTVLTTSTNAYNGYIVYGRVTQALTFGSNTIANYSSSNSSPSTWSGTGFGYTTSDADLTGGTVDRFSGTKYAGFGTSAPGDPVADHASPVTTAISSEQFTVSYRVTTSQEKAPGTYTTTVLYVVVPSY